MTLNRKEKRFFKRKFVDRYSYQVSNQLSEDKPLESLLVPLKLSIIKPIQAAWLVEFYGYMISAEGNPFKAEGELPECRCRTDG